MTLYLKLGGRPAFRKAIEKLGRGLSRDNEFKRSQNGNVLLHEDELCEFLIFLFGGAPFYDGMPICRVLKPLRLDDVRYDRFIDHVVQALTGDNSSIEDEIQLRLAMERIRPHIVRAPENRLGPVPQDQAGVVA